MILSENLYLWLLLNRIEELSFHLRREFLLLHRLPCTTENVDVRLLQIYEKD